MHALIAFLFLTGGDPALQPAGTIAYMLGGKLWIIDANGGAPRALTGELRYKADRPLTWSPDGTKLLYWNHSEIGWDIWVMDADGKNPRNLTNTPRGGSRSAAWSPDGKPIAFMRDDPPGLYVMNADGSNQKRLSEKGHRDDPPAWSPDGKRLAFTDFSRSGFDIHLIDADGRNPRLAVEHGRNPAWSPDGKRLRGRCGWCWCEEAGGRCRAQPGVAAGAVSAHADLIPRPRLWPARAFVDTPPQT